MPVNYKHYPPNWFTEIRPAILERAGNCCEFCGVENHAIGYRLLDGTFKRISACGRNVKEYNGQKIIKIVLTIAHLDHDPTNWNVSYDRLAALCQRCHFSYDRGGRYIKPRKKSSNKQTKLFQA